MPRCGGRERCVHCLTSVRRHRSGAVGIVCWADGSDRPSRRRRVLRERRAAAPPGAARAAGDRVRQRAARGRHDGVLRGAALRHRLGDADGARAPAVPRRGPRRAGLRRLPRGLARGDGARAPRGRPRRGRRARRGLPRPRRPRRAARGDAPPRERHPRGDRAWTARSGSAPTGSSRRSPPTPRSRAASSASRASRPASASPAIRPGSCRGSGPKTAARLEEMGITTLRALAATPVDALVARFGANHGPDLQRRARFEASARLTPVRTAHLRVARDDVRLRHLRRGEARGDPRRPRAPALRAARQAGPARAQRRDQGAPVGLHDGHAGAHDRRGDERPATVVTGVALELLREYAPARPVRLLGVRRRVVRARRGATRRRPARVAVVAFRPCRPSTSPETTCTTSAGERASRCCSSRASAETACTGARASSAASRSSFELILFDNRGAGRSGVARGRADDRRPRAGRARPARRARDRARARRRDLDGRDGRPGARPRRARARADADARLHVPAAGRRRR